MSHDNLPKTSAGDTRRQFIQNTTAVLSAASLASLAPAAYLQSDDTIKIALVGCGGRGSGAASQALSTSGPVKLVAAADAFKDRMDGTIRSLAKGYKDRVDVKDDHKFVGFDAYKKAIATADLVILATPPGFRPIHFAEAINQGKHVFMEKPVATDAPGVRMVLEYGKKAAEKGLAVGVGLQRHHQNVYIETIKRIKEGMLGDIVSSQAYWNGDGVWVRPRQQGQTEMEYQMRNWYYFNWLCGDHICEQHIHNLDVINWVKGGPPVRAQGMGGREVRKGKDHGEIFDHHFVEFEYADGSMCFSQCRHIPNTWSSVSEHVVGTKGRCNIGSGSMKFFNGETWKFKERHNDAYQTEHDDLFAAIRKGEAKNFNEAEYGAMSTMTSILGRLATYSGQKIDFQKALNSNVSLMPKDFSFDGEPPVKPDETGRYPIAVPGVWKNI